MPFMNMFRFLDILLSLIILFVALPICFFTSIAIIIIDGKPIFYISKRAGLYGKIFSTFKFRTMKLKNNILDQDEITFLGRYLRRLSIDELPQFYNVLKGDMSIVGPRPHLIEQTKFYSTEVKNFMQRHKCLPGITGWAQVNGLRGPTIEEGTMNKRFQHDLYYIKNWNLMFDFYIMIKTFFVILFQKVDE